MGISDIGASYGDHVEIAAHLRMAARASDDELADAIADCGDLGGEEFTLEFFLDCVPNLGKRSMALDAAIEVESNAMIARGVAADEAFASLLLAYPKFAKAIKAARLLGDAMRTTESLAARLTDPRPLALPCELGPALPDGKPRYLLHQLLGVGSQGIVYLAVDRALSEPSHPAYVAVKRRFPTPGVTNSAWNRGDEATKARRVIHPNVVRTLDRFIGDDGAAYIVQEYVRGGSLERWRASQPNGVSPRRAAELVVQIARGVQAAHGAELIHRDIKPGNVLMNEAEVAKVADFGIAATEPSPRSAERQGSLGFIAPEQYRLEPVATTADVYSLGGVLYWLLTARNPNGQTPEEAAAYLNRRDEKGGPSPAAYREGIDRDLDAITRRALAPDRSARYASADALGNDLENWLRGDVIAWNQPTVRWRLRKAIRRSPVAASIVLIVTVASLAGAIWSTRVLLHAEVERANAARERAEKKSEVEQDMFRRSKAVAETIKMMFDMEDTNHIAANWITAVTALENILGPNLMTPGSDNNLVWGKRLTAARKVVEELQAEGRQDQFECLVWESSLCLWLIRAGEGSESKRRLDSLVARWQLRLTPDDPWLLLMESFRDCAQILALGGAKESLETRRQLLAGVEAKAAKLPQVPLPLKGVIEIARQSVGD